VSATAAPTYRLAIGGRGYGTHDAVLELTRPGARLLDLGAAGGYIAELARDRLGARVLAVDVDPGACEESRARGIETIEADVARLLEEGGLAGHGLFDQVMMADVLEHLPDPGAALTSVRGLLAEGGEIIVSLPNIAYIRARARLARGVWRYERTGIFDETHLRFFTRATAHEMIARAGFAVVREIPIGPAGYALGRRAVAITRLRPELLASQLVILARPAG
jgi:2-polyprenyl-3-methyl-5-hydroxy-6-metoxy-1,4-benzoquinol methylase